MNASWRCLVDKDFLIHLPSLKVQEKIRETVTTTLRVREKSLEQARLLEELAQTLMLSWKDRDPETGGFEVDNQGHEENT